METHYHHKNTMAKASVSSLFAIKLAKCQHLEAKNLLKCLDRCSLFFGNNSFNVYIVTKCSDTNSLQTVLLFNTFYFSYMFN